MNQISKYGYKALTRKGMKIYFGDVVAAELVPHEKYVKHYYLQFSWRTDKTEEFFNIVNAVENAKRITLHRLNYDMPITAVQASLVR